MAEGLSLWSRVVLAQLNSPRLVKHEAVHKMDAGFNVIEDVKVKIKETSWKKQGRAVETILNLDLLFLMEDRNGMVKLFSQETSLKDRVPLQEFATDLELFEDKRIGFNGEIQNLSWQLDVNEQEVRIVFNLEYLIVATREQIVWLAEQSESLPERHELKGQIEELKQEIGRALDEKHDLQHQILLYERDISSLKRGIRKVESRNSLLDKESKYFQEMLAQLQHAMREQESRPAGYDSGLDHQKESGLYPPLRKLQEEPDSDLSLGKRVKRLFMNSI